MFSNSIYVLLSDKKMFGHFYIYSKYFLPSSFGLHLPSNGINSAWCIGVYHKEGVEAVVFGAGRGNRGFVGHLQP